MRIITATEFKAKCLALLDEVNQTGQSITITKHGKAVATLVCDEETDEKPWLKLRGKGTWDGDPFEPVVDEKEISVLR